MQWMRERLNKDEGFTLVELMVVVLIIAILIAIAIPTFLGARRGAQDRAAQAQVRNALVAEKAFYVDNNDYTGVLANIQALEPNLAAVTLSQPAANADVVCIEFQSETTTFFQLWESAANGTAYNSGAAALAACPDDPAGGGVPAGWSTDQATGW